MRGLKLTLIGSLAVTLLLGLSQSGIAFHDGGVARCAACHSMHASDNDVSNVNVANAGRGTPSGPTVFLLKYAKPSDTCLASGCHAGKQATDNGAAFTSGGDFFWVTANYTIAGGHGNIVVDGDKRGHNVLSDLYNVAADKQLPHAPGGAFLSSRLGCQSCHDPHGKDHNPLLLWGAGNAQRTGYGKMTPFQFEYGAPALVNAGRSTKVTDTKHTAYQSGMSQWCANCHTAMYNPTGADKHKVDIALSGYEGTYNDYILAGDAAAKGYLEAVPFEQVGNDCTVANTAATADSKVMCLTCHRSHASPWKSIGRWDFSAGLLAESNPNPSSTFVGTAPAGVGTTAQYGRTWGAEQRSLCNKCHAKD